MINVLPYLVYRDTPALGGAELIAGFMKQEDAIRYADQLQEQSVFNDKYFVKERREES